MANPTKGAINGRSSGGRFAAGWRGGPGGARRGAGPKPKATAEVKRRLGENASLYVDALESMASNPATPANVRADILKTFLTYAIGKPTLHIQAEVCDPVADMTGDQVIDMCIELGLVAFLPAALRERAAMRTSVPSLT